MPGGILDGLLQQADASIPGQVVSEAADQSPPASSPSQSVEERMAALLARIKGMTGQDEARRDLLVDLSDEEWEVYRRLRREDDARLLGQFEERANELPDVVHRIIVRTRLQVGTPVSECDAEAIRRQRS